MTTKRHLRAALEQDDVELARQSQAGDRDAFGQVVGRYQSLICSLAYSATGSIGRSEDLAQEVFLTAWKQLRTLREPQRLRSWLCGIARNIISNSFRREGREPLHAAESLEKVGEACAPDPLPSEQAISREEESLVWRALEQVPELYREPLILYYRQEQSVEAVASQLDLSHDAVRQRLARGRDLLRAEVISLIEGTLRRSRPGAAFTLAVMGALSGVAVGSATAAGLGAAGKVGAPAAKAAISAAAIPGLLGGLLGALGGLAGAWASWQTARYRRVRELIRRDTIWCFVVTLVFLLAVQVMNFHSFITRHPLAYGVTLGTCIIGYLVFILVWSLRLSRKTKRIIAEEIAAGTPPLPQAPLVRRIAKWASQWEGRQWRSRWSLLGLPLVHINFGSPPTDDWLQAFSGLVPIERRTARGWIAVGDRAQGVLFALGNQAFGGIAIGGISAGVLAFGGLAVGIVSIGGAAVGLLALGGLAIGGAAYGGLGLGWLAYGGGAFAWRAAEGGLACAHGFATGGGAIARHANDPVAKAFLSDNWFFSFADWLTIHMASPWHIAGLVVLPILVVALGFLVGVRRRKNSATGAV